MNGFVVNAGSVVGMKDSELGQAVTMAVILSVIFVVSYAVFGHTLLLRPFWMDEVHSWLLISDADPLHALQSLQHGADYNPPVYYAVARIFSWLAPLSEHNLRVLSVLLVLSTAIGLALVFDRHMKMPASIGCSLLICSQELVILQSTEARFYALWLALLTWFCFGLTTGKRSFQAIQLTVLSVLAAMTAGTHYFGIISIGLVCCAFVVARRFEKRAMVRAGIPFAAAVLAVACCLPLLSGQKAALTSATWVTAADFERSSDYVIQFFPRMLLLVAFAIWLVGFFLKSSKSSGENLPVTAALLKDGVVGAAEPASDKVPPDALIVFGSLLLMPLVLIIFSVVVQPALVNRYAIVGCLWLVPVLTLLLHTGETRKSILVLVAGCVMFSFGVRHGSATWDYNLKNSQQLTEQIRQLPNGAIVLFEDRIDYWMLQHKDPHQTWYQLDFEVPADSEMSNLRLVQRDVGRVIQPLYPDRFPMRSVSEFEGQDVYLIPYEGEQAGEAVTKTKRILSNISERVLKASAN